MEEDARMKSDSSDDKHAKVQKLLSEDIDTINSEGTRQCKTYDGVSEVLALNAMRNMASDMMKKADDLIKETDDTMKEANKQFPRFKSGEGSLAQPHKLHIRCLEKLEAAMREERDQLRVQLATVENKIEELRVQKDVPQGPTEQLDVQFKGCSNDFEKLRAGLAAAREKPAKCRA